MQGNYGVSKIKIFLKKYRRVPHKKRSKGNYLKTGREDSFFLV